MDGSRSFHLLRNLPRFDTRNIAAGWILLASLCSASGWILSVFHALWLLPYIWSAALIALLFARFRKRNTPRMRTTAFIILRNPFAWLFIIVSILVFAGGALHPPTNYDAMTYRFPRLLHWESENAWHWISTPVMRMNAYATGSEWLTLPFFQITHSDRLFFLVNFVSFTLLPGLLFGVFREVGISGRVARVWMWILPCAYGFALQAGSIGNDTIAVIFFLSAIYFALHSARANSRFELCIAILAASLMTGMKATNLTLLLPCAIAFWPARRMVFQNPKVVLGCAMVSLLTSALPITVLNTHYSGGWTGDPRNVQRLELNDPLAGVLGNTLQVIPQTILPPVLINSRKVEASFHNAIPDIIKEKLKGGFPRFKIDFGELPREESAGLGLGVFSLCVISLLARFGGRKRNSRRHPSTRRKLGIMIWAGGVIACLVYTAKAGSEATARLVLPYYPLLIVGLLYHPVNVVLARKRWWRVTAIVAAGLVLIPLILNPSRPLWSASAVASWMRAKSPESKQVARIEQVYSTYATRNDVLGSLRKHLPAEVKQVALVCGEDDSEVALWRPFGTRRVFHLMGKGSWDDETQGVQWIVGRTDVLKERFGKDLEGVLADRELRLVATEMITAKVAGGPEPWFVLARNR